MKQIEVTVQNVSHVPIHALLQRFNKLKRSLASKKAMWDDSYRSEMESEINLIRNHFKEKGAEGLLAEQIVMPGMPIPKTDTYKPIVMTKLRRHNIQLKRANELEQEMKRLGENIVSCNVEIIFPAITSNYGGGGGGWSEYKGSEKAIVQPIEQMERKLDTYSFELSLIQPVIDEMNRALSTLDVEEREIIEKKYLKSQREPLDHVVISTLHFEKDKYYEVKKSAILKIANFFKLI